MRGVTTDDREALDLSHDGVVTYYFERFMQGRVRASALAHQCPARRATQLEGRPCGSEAERSHCSVLATIWCELASIFAARTPGSTDAPTPR